jgi:cytidylate kinase
VKSPVLAIDGPAASGKSSTAGAVARRLGFLHVDSGALYRGLTRVAVDLGGNPGAAAILSDAEVRRLEYRVRGLRVDLYLDGKPAEAVIRDAAVTAGVSAVSAMPEVRDWVNRRLRALLAQGQPLVLDGRDIGTAVFPDAAAKVYLIAEPEVRAERRLRQRGEPADASSLRKESARIAARDQADSTRTVAPLRPAEDAILLDTSRLSFEQQVARIVAIAEAAGLRNEG